MNLVTWRTLQLCGVQMIPAETIDGVSYPEERLELRNCSCGSTLAVQVNPDGSPAVVE